MYVPNQLGLYKLQPIKSIEATDLSGLRISPNSVYSDTKWDFSSFEKNPSVKASASILYWDFKLPDGTRFSDDRYAHLLAAFKETVYALASSPRGKLPPPSTLKKNYSSIRYFMCWLIRCQLFSLTDLKREHTDRYIIEIKQDDGVHPNTKVSRLIPLKNIWLHRKELTDPISYDPLSGRSPHAVSAITRNQQLAHRYDFIPDHIAQNLVSACVAFVREKGVEVAIATQVRDSSNLDQIMRGKSTANRHRAKRAALKNLGITNAEVTTLSRQLLASCYVIINFFTGLRISDMLSMAPDQIYMEDGITWIVGRQHKIEKKAKRWMAPNIVFEAHHLAKSLTQPMRESLDYEIESTLDRTQESALKELRGELFLSWSSRRKHGYSFTHAPQVANIKSSIHTSLKELVDKFQIFDDSGKLWNLHSHQFRRSFVRFMSANAMNIRYLQEHMGHRSLDMTAWYDSDDIELTDLIIAQMREFKTEKIESIFHQNQNISGAGASSLISERRDFFVGIATVQGKETFVSNLAEDITLRSTGHSWCMGDTGNAKCTGVVGCMMDAGMTQKCTSALVTEEHLPAWQIMKHKNEKLLESTEIGRFQKEAIARIIKETIDPTIEALTRSREVAHHAEQK